MSERSTALLLSDIETAIAKILLYTKNYSFIDYKNDGKTRDAVERNFEIIGEASARLAEDFKLTHTTV